MNTQSHTFSWICLVLSGCLEVVWAYTMKLSHGFSDPLYTIITLVVLAINLYLLEKPVGVLGIGVSYGVFTGLGIVGTSIVGIVGLGESISIVKIASIAILMTGVIGLKYCDARETAQKAAVLANNLKQSKTLSTQAASANPKATTLPLTPTSISNSMNTSPTSASRTASNEKSSQEGDK